MKSWWVVMQYPDDPPDTPGRHVLGVLRGDEFYHVTEESQQHADGPFAFDTGLLVFLKQRGVKRIKARYRGHVRLLETTVELAEESGPPRVTTTKKGERRERCFLPHSAFRIVEFHPCPQPLLRRDEITLTPEGDVSSVGVYTGKEEAA